MSFERDVARCTTVSTPVERCRESFAGIEIGDDVPVAGPATQDAVVERAGTECLGDMAAKPPGAAGEEDGHVS